MSKAAYMRARYEAAKRDGKCVGCRKRDAVPGKPLCSECAELRTKRYEAAKRDGKCVRCHKRDAVPGKSKCSECAEYNAERYEVAKRDGKCCKCNTRDSVPGKTLCSECAEYKAERYVKRVEDYTGLGLCLQCKEHRPVTGPGSTRCLECWAKHAARAQRRRGPALAGFTPELALKVASQSDGTCPETGERIIPGAKLSLEHTFPVCDFPWLACEPTNLTSRHILWNLGKGEESERTAGDLFDRVGVHRFRKALREGHLTQDMVDVAHEIVAHTRAKAS